MTLGKTACTAYIHAAQQKKKLRTALKFFNFNDVTRSFRINPLTPNYLSSVSDTNELVAVLLKNFSPFWSTIVEIIDFLFEHFLQDVLHLVY